MKTIQYRSSRRSDRWVRRVAVAITVTVLLLELYVWYSWKVSQDVLEAFQEAVRHTSPTAP
jgi:hypothetical protein